MTLIKAEFSSSVLSLGDISEMVIRFADLGVPDPKGWSKPHCKVYDYNTDAGTFYYQV